MSIAMPSHLKRQPAMIEARRRMANNLRVLRRIDPMAAKKFMKDLLETRQHFIHSMEMGNTTGLYFDMRWSP